MYFGTKNTLKSYRNRTHKQAQIKNKYIKIIFFYFLKIIFDISTSKWSKNTKPYSFKNEKKKKLQTGVWNASQTPSMSLARLETWDLV